MPPVLHVGETPERSLKGDKVNACMWGMADAARDRPFYYRTDSRCAKALVHILCGEPSPAGATCEGTSRTDACTA